MRILASCCTCILGSLPALAQPVADGAREPLEEPRLAEPSLTELSYEATLVGPLAEVTVRQVFTNDTGAPLDARYVFPLHEHAAVDAMEMRIGDRTLTGEIEERSEAVARYRDALAQGQTAALTSQERPNVFQQQVGNIPAGAQVEVTLSLVQPVPRIDGSYELVLPLSVAPRFVPVGTSDDPWTTGTKPAVVPEVTVHGNPGFEVATLTSVNHEGAHLSYDTLGISAHTWADPSRDFRLRWTYAFDEPQVAFLHDGEHLLVLFEPPSAPPKREDGVPRELIWVLDTSCSMRGDPWARSRATLLAALDDLEREDHFQLVAFDNHAQTLFDGPVPATPQNLDRARAWVRALRPGGGTNLFKGIRDALHAPAPAGRQRVVTLLSDGQIHNEIDTLQTMEAYRGATRVHSLAVGDAPNRYLMEQIAHLGGGRFLAPELGADPRLTATTLMAAMERPLLAGVEVDWGALETRDLQPSKIPLLYSGQPLMLVGRFRGEPDTVRLSGMSGTEPWSLELEPQLVQQGRALASTWARQQVQALQDRAIREPRFDPRPDGLAIAIEYGVLSPWTSFVAIDPTSDVFDGAPDGAARVRPFDAPDGMPATAGSVGSTLTRGFLSRVPTGRTYQQATQMAAGVTVGATAGGNPNIGGAATNENVYLMDGGGITDPVTGSFCTLFNMDTVVQEASPARLSPAGPAPVSNNLALQSRVWGAAGSGLGGGLELAIGGPVVRDQLSTDAALTVAEDRTTTDTAGNPLQLGRQQLALTAASSLGPRSHASGTLDLARTRVEGDPRWVRETLGAGLHHLVWLGSKVRLDTEAGMRHASDHTDTADDRTLGADLRTTLGVSLKRHALSARLALSGVDRTGRIETPMAIDTTRLGSAPDKLRQTRGAVVLEHTWKLASSWQLASSVEGNLTRAGVLRPFLGGRMSLLGRPVEWLEVQATFAREALPLLAGGGPGERHLAEGRTSLHLGGPWMLRGGAVLQQLRLQDALAGHAGGTIELERERSRRWTALARYTLTHAFGTDRTALPGATGIRFVRPPHLLHTALGWTLPTDPFALGLAATFDTDFAGWTDLTLGLRQSIPVPRGSLEIGLRAANLLGSEADVVLDASDGRYAVVGRQRGRRLELDVSGSF